MGIHFKNSVVKIKKKNNVKNIFMSKTTPFSPIDSSHFRNGVGQHHVAIIGRHFNCNYLNKIPFLTVWKNKGISPTIRTSTECPGWNAEVIVGCCPDQRYVSCSDKP